MHENLHKAILKNEKAIEGRQPKFANAHLCMATYVYKTVTYIA